MMEAKKRTILPLTTTPRLTVQTILRIRWKITTRTTLPTGLLPYDKYPFEQNLVLARRWFPKDVACVEQQPSRITTTPTSDPRTAPRLGVVLPRQLFAYQLSVYFTVAHKVGIYLLPLFM